VHQITSFEERVQNEGVSGIAPIKEQDNGAMEDNMAAHLGRQCEYLPLSCAHLSLSELPAGLRLGHVSG
jgi:hypothetical protein